LNTATEQIKKFLSSVFRIQPGEGTKTTLMFGILVCIVGSFIVGRVARDSLFLSRYSVDYLPYLYIWVAFGVSILSYLYSRIADRFRRDRILKVTMMVIIAATLFARVSMYWAGDWFYPVLYVFVELAGTLLIIQTWTLAQDVFNTREAKRLFGLVGAGGVVSAVLVGLSVRGLVKSIGTENLLYLGAGVLVVGLVLVFRLASACREEILTNLTDPGRQAKARIKLSSDWARFFAHKQLVYVAGLVVLLGFVITFVDYQFKIAARYAFLNREEQLAGFFASFWAITGGINCIIQFFLTGRLLERFGIKVTLMILPIALMIGSGTILIVPALWSATMLKGGETVFRYTVNDASMQLLYLPVPSHFRGRAKAFIDGIVRPVSIGISGVVLAWVLPSLHPDALGWILLALLLCWILFVFGARKQYYLSLMRTLQTRRLHFGEVSSIIPDEAAGRVLRQALTDPDTDNVLHALDMTAFSATFDWSDDLVRLLGHKSSRVRAKALQLLRDRGTLKDGPQVFGRLRDSDPDVRAAAVEAYCAIGKERAIRIISGFLEDDDPEVRAATVVGLIRYAGLDGVLSAAEKLKGMLESHDPEERASGARILGDIGVKNFYHPLLSLMVDEELKVRVEAIRAAGKMGSAELMPALVYRIEERATRMAAAEALAAFGSPAVKLLTRVLQNSEENLTTRLTVPGILAKIADQNCMEALLAGVDDPNEDMRDRVLEAMHRLRLKKAHLAIPRERTQEALNMEIRNLYHQWFTTRDLKLPVDHLLTEALDHRRSMTTRRIFRLLGCLLPVRTIDTIYNNLSAAVPRIQANALELLDSMLDTDTKRLLLPLLDDALTDDRKEIGEEHFGFRTQNRNDRLVALMEDDNPWLSACSIWTTGGFERKELVNEIMTHTASASPLVRETTLLVLGKLMPEDRLRNTAERHQKDPATPVRNYANWLLKQLAAT
jgi:ATP/ADP translocase/HEAT repeat protein